MLDDDARGRILVVEDDPLTRKFFATVARERMPHARVLEAAGVTAARALLRDGAVLVLTDIHLGDGTGLEVLEAVRGSVRPEARVVAVTGLSGREAADLLQHGFDGVLTKPVELAALRELFDAHVPR